MLEMNPERGLETEPEISFEMPAHEMCTERRAVLCRADGQSEWMTFAIDFMPDKIHINGRKFVYRGVADGRGFYREEPKDNHERLRYEFSPRPGSLAESIEFETNYSFPRDTLHEPEIYHTHGSLGSMSAALRYAEALETEKESPETGCFPSSIHSADCELLVHCYHPKSTCTCRRTWHRCDCVRPGRITDEILPYQRSIALYGMDGFLADRDCLVCFGSGKVLENSQDSGPDSHTTASPCDNMPCSRCLKVLDLVSEMIENPPGLSGIRCHLGHIGNQYVDAGWVEALTRVKSRLVTGAPGTRETI